MKTSIIVILFLAAVGNAQIPRFMGAPEGKLANLLLDLPNETAVISIPAVILKSDHHPFPDQQTNAKLQTDFLAVGIQTGSFRKYNFDSKLKIGEYKEVNLGNGWYQVTPKGWNDSFYFNFDTSSLEIDRFLAGIPVNLRTFSQGRVAPDPARIGNENSLTVLKQKQKGEGYNEKPYENDNVHAHFPNENGEKTAVGGVLTWAIEKPFSSFKHLYTCFEARNLQKEKQHNVPSGAGWHRIGDSGESILNTLEKSPIPVAIARSHNSRSLYSEAVTAFWLRPGEVFVAPRNVFHWFVNPYPKDVCAEIWVHNCVPGPNNNWGFNCQ
jgi:hypothetical protein